MAPMERTRKYIFVMFTLMNLVVMLSAAPIDDETRPQTRRKSLASPLRKSGIEEVGNPVDLAWKAWIRVDNHGLNNAGVGFDSASLLRRITPKSIFIAPSLDTLPACAEGYQADPMNRCVKNVNLNHEAHIDFLVQRLNAMYANLGGDKPDAAAASSSGPTGPLQLDLLNIPDLIGTKNKKDEKNLEDIDVSASTAVPSEPEEDEDEEDSDENNKKSPNEDSDEEEEEEEVDQREKDGKESFFLGSQATKDGSENDESNSTKIEGVLPIVDFVDDTNSSFSEVIDYKVESDGKLINRTQSEKGQEDSDEDESFPKKESSNDALLSPTVVLLLTPTKLPIPNGSLIAAHNSTTGKWSVRRDHGENGTEPEELISVKLPENLATASTPIQIFLNTWDSVEKLTNSSEFVPLIPEKTGESTETELPEETETETIPVVVKENEEEDVEESTESEEEILTHSEAGAMVTKLSSIQSTTADGDERETTTSKISSEVSINNDFIRETILLGLNLEKGANSTESNQTTSPVANEEKVVTVTPEITTEPEVSTLSEDTSSYTDDAEKAETTEENSETESESTTTTKEALSKQTEHPVTKRIYEAVPTDQRELNPVVKIEELLVDETSHTSSTKSPSVISSSELPESSEIMTASSSNNAETFFPQFHAENSRFPIKQNHRKIGSIFHSTDLPGRFDTKYVTSTSSDDVDTDVYTEIKTIDDQEEESSKFPERPNFFPDQPKLPAKEFVRFPSYEKPQNRPNHVRFPSEEANSIHSPDNFKDRHHHQPYPQQVHRNSLKNPSSAAQKQSYWLVPPNWRTDRQQSVRSKSSANDKLKDRSPMWFWTRMPLLRDPSLLYPTYPTIPNFDRPEVNSHRSRRINYYKEMSPHDVTRAFARSSPIGV